MKREREERRGGRGADRAHSPPQTVQLALPPLRPPALCGAAAAAGSGRCTVSGPPLSLIEAGRERAPGPTTVLLRADAHTLACEAGQVRAE